MTQHMDESKKSTNKYYFSLLNSYNDIQKILFPTLKPQKQKLLTSIFKLISSQITTLKNLIDENSNDFQPSISSNMETLSKDIAMIFELVKNKNTLLVYNQQIAFTYDHTNNKIRNFLKNNYYDKKGKSNSTIKIQNRHTTRSSSSLYGTENKNKQGVNPLTNSSNKENSVIKKKVKSNFGSPLSPTVKSKIINRVKTPPSSDKKNKTMGFEKKEDLDEKKGNDPKNNSFCKASVNLKKIFPRSRSSLKKKRPETKEEKEAREKEEKEKNKILNFEAFAEKTEKDFEKIGAKPSNYAKYLVKKYKDVVQKYDQIDNEEMRLSGRTLTHKSNSSQTIGMNKSNNFDLSEYIKKNKNKFYQNGRYGFLFEAAGVKSTKQSQSKVNNTINVDEKKVVERIHVMKQEDKKPSKGHLKPASEKKS